MNVVEVGSRRGLDKSLVPIWGRRALASFALYLGWPAAGGA
jgi:hypothetical protein